MMSKKGSLSAAWIVGLFLLTQSAAGCGVSGSGLGGRFDSADGPKQTSDAKQETTLDASPLLPETGSDAVPESAPDGVRDTAPNTVADAAPWDTAGTSSDHVSSPEDAPRGPDLVPEDAPPATDVPIVYEVQPTPDVRLVPDGRDEQDGIDEGLPVDGPATPPVDEPTIDAAPVDAALPDLAPVDLERDLPTFADLPVPDLAPADVGPQPTVNWVVDNTTNIGGFTPAVMGAPTVTAVDAGTAVCFDGTHDGLQLDTNPVLGMPRFTIETLVFPEFPGTSDPRVIYIGDASTSSPRLTIQMRSGASGTWHSYTAFYWAGVTTILESSTTQLAHPSNHWYWLAVTYDGQTARTYVDGVLEDSTSLTFGPMTTGSTTLGSRQGGQYFFPGCIHDVQFFNRALPASQLNKP
jgi:hypothetical protein